MTRLYLYLIFWLFYIYPMKSYFFSWVFRPRKISRENINRHWKVIHWLGKLNVGDLDVWCWWFLWIVVIFGAQNLNNLIIQTHTQLNHQFLLIFLRFFINMNTSVWAIQIWGFCGCVIFLTDIKNLNVVCELWLVWITNWFHFSVSNWFCNHSFQSLTEFTNMKWSSSLRLQFVHFQITIDLISFHMR